MNVFGYEISQTEMTIGASIVGLIVGLFILTRFPKWIRVWVLLVIFLAGVTSLFWVAEHGSLKLEQAPKKELAKPEQQKQNAEKNETLRAFKKEGQRGVGSESRERAFETSGGEGAPEEDNKKFASVRILYGTDRTVSQDVHPDQVQ